MKRSRLDVSLSTHNVISMEWFDEEKDHTSSSRFQSAVFQPSVFESEIVVAYWKMPREPIVVDDAGCVGAVEAAGAALLI